MKAGSGVSSVLRALCSSEGLIFGIGCGFVDCCTLGSVVEVVLLL